MTFLSLRLHNVFVLFESALKITSLPSFGRDEDEFCTYYVISNSITFFFLVSLYVFMFFYLFIIILNAHWCNKEFLYLFQLFGYCSSYNCYITSGDLYHTRPSLQPKRKVLTKSPYFYRIFT